MSRFLTIEIKGRGGHRDIRAQPHGLSSLYYPVSCIEAYMSRVEVIKLFCPGNDERSVDYCYD